MASGLKALAGIAAFILCCAAPVRASERSFVIGVEDVSDLPHNGVVDGEYVGIGREILESFAAEQGYKLTFKILPIRRQVRALVSGECDFKYPDNPLWDADAKGDAKVVYSRAVSRVVGGAMVTPKNLGKTSRDIKILGTLEGYTPIGWQGRLKTKQISLVEFHDTEPLLAEVIAGHIDAAYIGLANANLRLQEMGKMGQLVFNPSMPFETTSFDLSTIRHPEVVVQFNAWLAKHRAEVHDILSKNGAETDTGD